MIPLKRIQADPDSYLAFSHSEKRTLKSSSDTASTRRDKLAGTSAINLRDVSDVCSVRDRFGTLARKCEASAGL